MFEAEKQLTKIINSRVELQRNSFGFLTSFIILVLARIIIAKIQILRVISIDDIRSIPEKGDIDIKELDENVHIIEKGVRNIKNDAVIHQYFFVKAGKIITDRRIK